MHLLPNNGLQLMFNCMKACIIPAADSFVTVMFVIAGTQATQRADVMLHVAQSAAPKHDQALPDRQLEAFAVW